MPERPPREDHDVASIRREVRSRLLSGDRRDLETLTPPERRHAGPRTRCLAVLREERAILPAGIVTEVVNQVSDEVVGLGPIERLLKDPEVSEVMVNGADDVYVERKGRVERVDGRFFEGEEQVFHLIERIVSPLGLRVDESMPYVDARLSDGSRVNAIIPPLSLCGPVVTIRKFTLRPLTPGRPRPAGHGLGADDGVPRRVRSGPGNVMVSGGTGSGKTTLLGALSSFIPHERATHHHRGRGGASARAAARRLARVPAAQRRGRRRGDHPLARAQRAAHAAGPDHRRRGPGRRGPRHAPGDEHRARGFAVHGPRQLPAGPPLAPGDDGADVRRRAARVTHVREQIAGALDLVVHMTRLPDGRRAVTRICGGGGHAARRGLHGRRLRVAP